MKLEEKIVKQSNSEIRDDLSEEMHIQKRISAKNKAIGKLTALGLTSEEMHPNLKAHLIKTYIRPILTYRAEKMVLSKQILNKLKRHEGNVLKNCLNIPTRCHSTDLYSALNIGNLEVYIKRDKIKFFIRLANNPFTKDLLETMSSLKDQNSFTTEIATLLKLNKDYDLGTIISEAKQYIKQSIKDRDTTKRFIIQHNKT